jgi:hypothetical protein
MQITTFLLASGGALLSLAAFWLIDSLREEKVTPRHCGASRPDAL